MKDFSQIYCLPNAPAVYAFYIGGKGPQYAAYVGIAGKRKQRIVQRLVSGESSVAAGASAASPFRIFVWGIKEFYDHISEKELKLEANAIFGERYLSQFKIKDFFRS